MIYTTSKAAYIVSPLRTPVGRYGGVLASVRPDDLAAHIIKAVLADNPGLDLNVVEDVIFGAANQAGEDNRNVARMAGLLAGLPITTAGVTVNRLCASGLQAIMDASRMVMLGDAEVVVAGGVESMSRAPFVLGKADSAFGRGQEMHDTTMGWRFINPALSALHHPFGMGETAENVADRYSISREEQDAFALASQEKTLLAQANGTFADELVAVTIPQRKGEAVVVNKDEHPRQTSMDQLAKLKPAFKAGGSVTAGNSSGINDGAAACLVVSEDAVKRYNLKPIARVAGMGVAGVEPAIMGMGPVPASLKALKRAGVSIQQLQLAELNEAFAVQVLACMRELEINPSIVNLKGGAIALGHPLGCSGARITATLLHQLKHQAAGSMGLATMCIGVGQGAAVVYERV